MGRPDDEVSEAVIGACISVHRALGPGLLESAYHDCLGYELTVRGMTFEREVAVPINYKGVSFGVGYRLDLVVENRLIIELKAVEALLPLHQAQLRTYLKLTSYPVGLLVNFNVAVLRHGLRRLESTTILGSSF
jgi:GxxExxY protein